MAFDIEHQITQARQHVALGEYSIASDICTQMLTYAPHDFAFFLLGVCQSHLEDHTQAVPNFQVAIDMGLVDWSCHLYLARSLVVLKRQDEALEHYEAALKNSPENPEVLCEILKLLIDLGRFEDARKFYSEIKEGSRDEAVEKVWSNFRMSKNTELIDFQLRDGAFLKAKQVCQEFFSENRELHYFRMIEYIEAHEEWLTYVRSKKRKKPLLTVLLITYNHEKFIGKAIQSVLDQETDFDIKIHIAEDCSTDNTRDVIMKYKKKHPEKIDLYFNPTNIGTLDPPQQKVTYAGLKRLDGDYIAILEGDDYWSSKDKAQIQISFLEKNPGYAATAHNTIKVYEDGRSPPHKFIYHPDIKPTHSIEDFINMTSFFHTTSIIYRNVFCGHPPKEFASKWSCDIFNTISHLNKGRMYYMDLDMSVYRAHSGGNYSTLPEKKGRIFNIEGLRRYNKWLGYRYVGSFSYTIARLCNSLLESSDAGTIDKLTAREAIYYKCMAKSFQSVFWLTCKFPRISPATLFHGEPVPKNKGT